MSSSIVSGLSSLLEIEANLDALVITLCDQPNISSDSLDRLIDDFRMHGPKIVASSYRETLGVPAVFSRVLFEELSNLDGDKGARTLIHNRSSDVSSIEMEEAEFDIDTPRDLTE